MPFLGIKPGEVSVARFIHLLFNGFEFTRQPFILSFREFQLRFTRKSIRLNSVCWCIVIQTVA
jgi:hypothetical protein